MIEQYGTASKMGQERLKSIKNAQIWTKRRQKGKCRATPQKHLSQNSLKALLQQCCSQIKKEKKGAKHEKIPILEPFQSQ